jgi:hypothetical protein
LNNSLKTTNAAFPENLQPGDVVLIQKGNGSTEAKLVYLNKLTWKSVWVTHGRYGTTCDFNRKTMMNTGNVTLVRKATDEDLTNFAFEEWRGEYDQT